MQAAKEKVQKCAGAYCEALQKYIHVKPPFVLIYVVVNLVNLKCYVGKSKTKASKRMDKHMSGTESCPLMSRAVHKYGKGAFVQFVVKLLDDDAEEVVQHWEDHYMHAFDTLGRNGYNLIPSSGVAAYSDRALAHFKAVHNQPHVVQNHCKANKIVANTPAVVAKRVASYKTTINTEESKKKRSTAIKKAHGRSDVQERVRAVAKVVHNTESAKKNHSIASKSNWSDAQFRKKCMASQLTQRKAKIAHANAHALPFEPDASKRIKGQCYVAPKNTLAKSSTQGLC